MHTYSMPVDAVIDVIFEPPVRRVRSLRRALLMLSFSSLFWYGQVPQGPIWL